MRGYWVWPLMFVICAILAAATGWASARHSQQAIARQVKLLCATNKVVNDYLTGVLHRQQHVLNLDKAAGKTVRARIDRNGIEQLQHLLDGYAPSIVYCEGQ